ncbi:hypothetical protein EYF80_047184 [Liparis tanakae]|uniref:Uncharacterized protein n=1 Tax=Liparis tanakae TaxID=230148 RepID=A0A4Z2FNB5_9TELE|nr:hypothetical protein EYF80_047184 [Liparis tanakae]
MSLLVAKDGEDNKTNLDLVGSKRNNVFKRAGLLQQVPELLPLVGAAAVLLLLAVLLPQRVRLPPQLLVHLLLLLVVARLAARLQVDLVDAPVVQLLAEGQGAHLLHHVQLPRAVEVEDGGEGHRVAVEEVLVLREAVVVADLQQRLVGVAVPQAAQAGPGQPVQCSPQDLVRETPDVEPDPSGARLDADDVDGLGGEHGGRGVDLGPAEVPSVRHVCGAGSPRAGGWGLVCE